MKDDKYTGIEAKKLTYIEYNTQTSIRQMALKEEGWIDDFENLYDIKLSKKELPLVQKYFEEWLAEPSQVEICAEYKWRSAILKSLSSLSKLKFGRWKFKNENVKNILLDCYNEIN